MNAIVDIEKEFQKEFYFIAEDFLRSLAEKGLKLRRDQYTIRVSVQNNGEYAQVMMHTDKLFIVLKHNICDKDLEIFCRKCSCTYDSPDNPYFYFEMSELESEKGYNDFLNKLNELSQ